MFRWLFAGCAFALCLFLMTGESEAGKKKKANTVSGKIVAIDVAKDATDEGTLTIKTAKKKKKGGAAEEGKEVKIEVKKTTKIEKAGKKKEPPTPATFADLKVDQAVTVFLQEGSTNVAEKVLIKGGKKKKAK